MYARRQKHFPAFNSTFYTLAIVAPFTSQKKLSSDAFVETGPSARLKQWLYRILKRKRALSTTWAIFDNKTTSMKSC